MIKLFFKYVMYFSLFIASFIFFFPKDNLYYLLEKKLSENKLIISNEVLEEKLLSYSIKKPDIYYENTKVSQLKDISFEMLFFKNSIKLSNIKIVDDFKKMLPENIDFITVTHNIKNPILLDIQSKGEFGTLSGTIRLYDKIVNINLNASNKMKQKYKSILKQMQLQKGVYTYEYKY